MNSERFVIRVREYVALIDSAETSGAHQFLCRCADLLPQLYVSGRNIPDIELPDAEETRFDVQNPMGKIAKLLGRYDSYAVVFDPVHDEEVVHTTLSDDLGDIYCDLKSSLLEFELGIEDSQKHALWEWKFGMNGHTGDHLVNAIKVIHRLINDHMDPDYISSADDE